jgi:hypothetical protein
MRSGPIRNRRRAARGQVMLLFALMGVLLLVIAGLAIDAGMSYFSSDQLERAAAAGALAGVVYLPSDLPDATQTALIEVARNGFSNAGSGNSCTGSPAPSPCVIVTQPSSNRLTVTVQVTVPTTFLRLLGFGPHIVQRSATAEYLPPIALGQPGNQLGSALVQSTNCDGIPTTNSAGGYCVPTSGPGLGIGSSYYVLRSEAWGVDRSEGDGFTPTPNDSADNCGADGAAGECIANTPDYHLISELNGTDSDALNNDGGQNYLITVPAGQAADVQIYNPSFDPNTDDDANASVYTIHDDDGDFPNDCSSNNATTGACTATAPDQNQSDYSAMAYTLFSVPTLASTAGETELSQQIFYPFNATNLEMTKGGVPVLLPNASYFYWSNDGTGSITTVSDHVPAMFHQWVSVVQPSAQITNSNDMKLYQTTDPATGYLVNNTGVTEYYRLRVDTLGFNKLQTVDASETTSANAVDESSGQPLAHDAYAVRVVPSSGSCTGCTVSAMNDMTVYTPVQGGTCQNFEIPLFYLDPSYAGQIITVDLFDVGDVGGGAAYVGIVEPTDAVSGSTSAGCSTPPSSGSANDLFAQTTATTIPDIGTSLVSSGSRGWANADNVSGVDTSNDKYDAVIQTAANSGGTSLWNGQWLQFNIQVPTDYTVPTSGVSSCTSTSASPSACYWNLYYSVNSNATAGDTFSVYASFGGTPVRLLP